MSISADQELLECFEDVITRDHRVELHTLTNSGDLVVSTTRILGVTEDQMIVGVPQSIGKDVFLPLGVKTDAYLKLPDLILRFQTKLICNNQRLTRKDGRTFEVAYLTKPTRIIESQRRNTFRLVASNLEELKISFHHLEMGVEVTSPWPGEVETGTAINLSEGGIGLRLETPIYSKFIIGSHYSVQIKMPGNPRPVHLVAELRSSGSMLQGEATRLGLMFLRWPNARYYSQMSNHINQYIVKLEREQAQTQRAQR